MKKLLLLCFLLMLQQVSLMAQSEDFNPEKRLVVKSNLLNLLAGHPTLAVEKLLSDKWSIQASLVKGRIRWLFLTDNYEYQGFLLSSRYYFNGQGYRKYSPFISGYVGNLNRTIQTTGESLDKAGFFAYRSRNFYGKSIRAGSNIGWQYIFPYNLVLDSQIGLGFSSYYQQEDKAAPLKQSKGYLDFSIWVSAGYCF